MTDGGGLQYSAPPGHAGRRIAASRSMQTLSIVQRIRNRIVFVPEEPGYLVVLVLLLAFLALTPKAGCSFQEQAAAPIAAASH